MARHPILSYQFSSSKGSQFHPLSSVVQQKISSYRYTLRMYVWREGGREGLTFYITVNDSLLVVEILQSVKQLEGEVVDVSQAEWTIPEEMSLHGSYSREEEEGRREREREGRWRREGRCTGEKNADIQHSPSHSLGMISVKSWTTLLLVELGSMAAPK